MVSQTREGPGQCTGAQAAGRVPTAPKAGGASRASGWGAVFALTLCVATLIASEFMPVSLLTPIAGDLHMSEGRAGQAIAVSGIFAVLTSLGISSATRGIDRRRVLLALTLAMLVSGVMVALAPNAAVFMAGRALVGVVIGGFWSMSAATVMRLVPEKDVSRAMGMLNGGNALATTVAAPLGSFLGQYVGWRGAFFAVVPLAALTLGWLFVSLPSMPAESASGGSVFRVLRRTRVPAGMLAVTLLFLGQFALFTYLRPFLETVTGVGVSTLSLLLLLMGGAGLVGTWLIGVLLRTRLHGLLIAMPLAMAAIAIALTLVGGSTVSVGVLLAGWGLIGTAAPVAWWTWLSRALPDDAEAGGGLMVAVIQLAITCGATTGGAVFDSSGASATFLCSAGILVLAGVAAFATRHVRVRAALGTCGAELMNMPLRRVFDMRTRTSLGVVLLAFALLASPSAAQARGSTLAGDSIAIIRRGSRAVQPGPSAQFTGTVRVEPLFAPTGASRASGASVTFDPGARTAWHTHPLGQTLVVLFGRGLVQREGGPVEEIRPGDVVWFAPSEKHWHGASPENAMQHIAIQEVLDGKAVDWLEQVSNEQYHGQRAAR